ncbi:RimK-like ATP-grasp domain-containing protein [Actinoplanes regularis]|uniref:RimK-like ATP-grasp domain-containing protein n=2 Tax=Actinoplanes regularis TaxID=52697 RepID=A0A238X4R5_9ACTN|nr:RimK family alpha-L-glutamate ligase [Actinoplanes regularis]SNR54015.1 RimK-like ATP-grasp domain-containing protein [Actinoplanes regularis]
MENTDDHCHECDQALVGAVKLGIIAWEKAEPEAIGTADVARERGHSAVVFELDDVRCDPSPGGAVASVQGTPLSEFDVILCRCDLSTPPWTEKIQQLLLLNGEPGVIVLDPLDVHIRAASKRAMLQQLTLHGIPVPPTKECRSAADVRAALDAWGQVVVKPALGYRGLDVERILEGPTTAALQLIDALLERHGTLLCQPYLEHTGDYRVLIIGSKVSSSMRFDTAADGDWKPFSGDLADDPVSSAFVEPPDELTSLALRAAKAADLTIAGVDIIMTEASLTVIEVNPVPGWAAWTPELARVPNGQLVDFAESQANAQGGVGATSAQRWR